MLSYSTTLKMGYAQGKSNTLIGLIESEHWEQLT